MKKQKYKIGLYCLLMISIFCIVFFSAIFINRKVITTRYAFTDLYQQSSKVILFIGDGMGENHIEVAKEFLDKKMVFENFSYQGKMSTFSKSLFLPTDSAASATALATGTKVKNGSVSKKEDKNLEIITEYVKKLDKGVGIVTTDSLVGATPAAFSSHANNRSDTKDIIEGQINSNIDLFLGAGVASYASYKEVFVEKNYLFTNDFGELSVEDEKIFGVFEEISNYNHQDTKPTLPKLVSFAIDFMEANFSNGYFLLVEAAHIDKMSHAKDILKMISYLDELNNAVDEATKKTINQDDIAIIVTADHETGKLAIPNGQDINSHLYKSKSHTKRKVKFFIQLPNNQKIQRFPSQIDNTDIYKICYQLIS